MAANNACADISFTEAYDFAMTLEEEGIKFYESLAKSYEGTQTKNEMLFLRDEEEKHRELFKKLLKDTQSGSKKISGELKACVEEEILNPLKEKVKAGKVSKGSDALRLGVEMEKRTISFFEDLREKVGDKADTDVLDKVLEEEKNHLRKLNIILSY